LATVFGVTLNWRSDGLAQPAFNNSAHHSFSTFRRQRRILVAVHSVLRESLAVGDFRVPGPGQMDNLLKDHS
jgi:hypothetical protein